MHTKFLSLGDCGWAGSAVLGWSHCFISFYAKYRIASCGLEKTCLDGDGKDESVWENSKRIPESLEGSESWLWITAEILCPGGGAKAESQWSLASYGVFSKYECFLVFPT